MQSSRLFTVISLKGEVAAAEECAGSGGAQLLEEAHVTRARGGGAGVRGRCGRRRMRCGCEGGTVGVGGRGARASKDELWV